MSTTRLFSGQRPPERPPPRLLVTGGDGFIGRHLVRALTFAGTEVLVIDNNVTSVPNTSPRGIDRIVGDVSTVDLDHLPRVDAIVHLASIAAPKLFAGARKAVIDANVLGTARLLHKASRDGARFLFASSSEVYGHGDPNDPRAPFAEDARSYHGLLGERTCYGAAKRLGEELVLAARDAGTDAASIRLFNVYGPGMDPTNNGHARVVPEFMRALADYRPLPVEGHGRQTRSFTWIGDVVEGLCRLLAHEGPLPPAVNLGHPQPTSITQLAQLMQAAVGRFPGVAQRPRSSEDPDWRRPDCALLRATCVFRATWAPSPGDLGTQSGRPGQWERSDHLESGLDGVSGVGLWVRGWS